jgi:hypothetical protein
MNRPTPSSQAVRGCVGLVSFYPLVVALVMVLKQLGFG